MNGRKFSWFPKFTDVMGSVPEEHRCELMWALVQYGTYGVEPDLDWPLAAIFAALREDVDNSNAARGNGAKGGAKSRKGGNGRAEETATPLAQADKGGNEDAEACVTPPAQTDKGGNGDAEECVTPLAEGGKGGNGHAEEPVSHTNPYQAIPDQAKPESEGRARRRFTRPGRPEVEAYAHEIGLPPGEVPKWFDHYDACGWVVGRNKPMRDWKAALRNWKARLHEFSRKEATDDDDEYSRLV